MIYLDDLAEEYLSECRDHLATIDQDLIRMEKDGVDCDGESVNRIFCALHSIKGGAGVFSFDTIRDLAHKTEDVLARIRAGELLPTPGRVDILIRATDVLRDLIQNPKTSNQFDITNIVALLGSLSANEGPHGAERSTITQPAQQTGKTPLMLLVEDDFASRLLLQTFLSRYGECHIAANGREAVEACRSSLERDRRYDLICMDIMMPEMDGREAVRQIRALEQARGILSTQGAKIIMTTTVGEMKEVILCFRELCDAYLVKPIDLSKLLCQMKAFHLIG